MIYGNMSHAKGEKLTLSHCMHIKGGDRARVQQASISEQSGTEQSAAQSQVMLALIGRLRIDIKAFCEG